jgi:UDP-N-acetylglucosamine 2-epimerase
MKVLTVVGARPQFIKAAPVSRALRKNHSELLIHTGQHYDERMSEVFFEELGIPAPDANLGIAAGTHAEQTAQMLVPLEALMVQHRPDIVMVYGDTNSTLAGGLAAAKLTIPVAHVEAGLRSFDRSMPEELNRVLVDHLATLLLCPTPTAVQNLAREGVASGVSLIGDVMLDTARLMAEQAEGSTYPADLGLSPGGYYLATVHRAANSDDAGRLSAIVSAFGELDAPVVWPIHPRTVANLARFGLDAAVAASPRIIAVSPTSYSETNALLRNAKALLTDSGGMQKEAYFFGVPCLTLRDTTEWTETIELGWNRLVGFDADSIRLAASTISRPTSRPPVYGDGHAAQEVVRCLEEFAGGSTLAPSGSPIHDD